MKEKIKQLEQQIEREKQKSSEYLEKGKGIQNEYTPIIIKEIKNNIKKEIEKFVKTDIENTNNLGIENLSEMKKEMNVLIESTDNLSNMLLENTTIWKVSQEFINSVDFDKDDIYSIKSNNEKTITKNVEVLIKNEFIKTGSILIKYGYLKDKTIRPWEKKGDTFIYDSIVWLSDDLRSKMKIYTSLFSFFVGSKEAIIKLEKELEQTKALFLWEQA